MHAARSSTTATATATATHECTEMDLGMSMCCIREAEDNKRRAEVMARLEKHDFVKAAVEARMGTRLMGQTARSGVVEGKAVERGKDVAGEEEDDDEEDLVWEARMQRFVKGAASIPELTKRSDVERSSQPGNLRITNSLERKKENKLSEDEESSDDDDDGDDTYKQRFQAMKPRQQNGNSKSQIPETRRKESEESCDEEEDDKRCKKPGCGRTYRHQHVESLKKS